MVREFKVRSSGVFWSFRWSLGEKPIVLFSNPKVRTNIIYTKDQLETALAQKERGFGMRFVSRKVLQSAMDVLEETLAQTA